MREEEIEIGERMMLVSDRMRKEVLVLLENILYIVGEVCPLRN